MGRAFYRPELDAMRWFAFLCVFFHHTLGRSSLGVTVAAFDLQGTLSAGLKFAVSLFFLLSGYLITTLLTMEREATGRVHLAAFYQRRAARILPLYYSFVVVAVLVAALGPPAGQPSGHAVTAFSLFAGNWYLSYGGAATAALGILWSVNIEEQIYLVWPVLAGRCNRRGLTLLSMVIVVASYGTLLWLGVEGNGSDVMVRFNTLVEMQFFAGGALLAVWLPRHGFPLPAAVRLLLGASGLLSWIMATRSFGGTANVQSLWWMPAALYSCVFAGCLALFLSFFGMPDAWIPRPFLWLGKISYGLYVYHVLVLHLMPRPPAASAHRPALALARIGLELLFTIAIAAASYHFLERPFLRWKERVTFVPNRQP